MAIPTSCYIHVPFCNHRCGYCDFTLVAGRDDLKSAYLHGLQQELSLWMSHHQPLGGSPPFPLNTLYWGGGTPTYLTADELCSLHALVLPWFQLSSCDEATIPEFTVEANPQGLDESRIEALAAIGCNRISLGVQSFDETILMTLERDHSPAQVESVVRDLRTVIHNISLDLIFGVPGQSFESWQETVQRALDLEPNHVSAYGLTFEKGTSFWSRREKGMLQPVDDQLERDMYAYVIETLGAAGLKQYEVSSFARDGFQSQHNQVYWTGQPYFAFGPGASRYHDGQRDNNHRSLFTWLKKLKEGELAVW